MKGQLFSSDLIAAFMIFLILIGSITFVYSRVLDSHSRDLERKFLESEGTKLMENLVRTKGLPENWEDLIVDEYSADANTKGLWHLNEGSGSIAADSSGNSNNGTVYNNGAVGADWTTGYLGQANNFNTPVLSQPDKIEIPGSSGSSLDVHGSLTLEAWIKPISTSSRQGIITRNFHSAFFLESNGKIKFGVDGFSGFVSVESTSTISPNVWTHVAGVFDSTQSKLRIYINGVLDKEGSGSVSTWYTNSNPVVVGNSRYAVLGSDHCCPFSGIIDEVRFSNSVRSTFNVAGPDPIVIGLSSGNNNILDSDKVDKFFSLDYSKTKNITGLGSNFELKFISSNKTKGSAPNSSVENVVFLRRIALYNSSIETVEMRLWR